MKEERLDIRLLQAHYRLVGNPGASAIITKALGRSEKGGDSFSETEVSLSLRCLATEWIDQHAFLRSNMSWIWYKNSCGTGGSHEPGHWCMTFWNFSFNMVLLFRILVAKSLCDLWTDQFKCTLFAKASNVERNMVLHTILSWHQKMRRCTCKSWLDLWLNMEKLKSSSFRTAS